MGDKKYLEKALRRFLGDTEQEPIHSLSCFDPPDAEPQGDDDAEWQKMLFEVPVGQTLEEWRENVGKTELYRRGDTVLIWVNEGDLYPEGPFVRNRLATIRDTDEDAEWLLLLVKASRSICPRLTDDDRERLERIANRLASSTPAEPIEATEAMIEAGLAYLTELGLKMDDGCNDWLRGLWSRMSGARP